MLQAALEEEDQDEILPFEGIDKAAVLHDCKEFSAVNVKIERCTETMSKILFLIASGRNFQPEEATEVFFGATKLFQCSDPKLRRMLFLTLKELSASTEQGFIACASLVKDINEGNDVYKTNAIRALRKVMDSTMQGSMERFLKQAVVDKNNNVVSAAIVTAIHIGNAHPQMIKRWGAEVNEALKTRGNRVQYHALALLHKLRQNDRLSVMKLVQQSQSGPIRSPLALCLLIRMCTECMREDFSNSLDLYKFVNNMLHHSSDVVVFEAAKSLCSLTNITAKEIAPAVMTLQLYLPNHKHVLRFAAVRLLNRVATHYPTAVAACNLDLEALITDNNRSIATLAITTLLKTGSEFTMDRLMRAVGTFLRDINDEFKTIVINSMRVVSVKYPHKYVSLLTFLSSALHEDGGADFKQAIIETIVSMIDTNPSARDACLQNLAEYIEDCEYNAILQRVLYLLGQHGPKATNPGKLVRYIYNRVALEVPAVRAVAITTLAKFGAQVVALRPKIAVLMKRTITDDDDEVRDRAAFYYRLFTQNDENAIHNLISGVTESVIKERQKIKPIAVSQDFAPLVSSDVAANMAPPANAEEAAQQKVRAEGDNQTAFMRDCRDKLRKIAQFREMGEPLKSCDPIALTEPDNEYVVNAVKHIYGTHTIFQFKITNTMEDSTLHKVSIVSDCSELDAANPKFSIPCEQIPPASSECCYLAIEHDGGYPTGSVSNTFNFALADHDDEDPDIENIEEYPLDEFAMNLSDHIVPSGVGDFERQWTALAEGGETSGTFQLATMRNLTQAAHEIIDFFGMKVAGERPEKVTTKSHVINMSGTMCNEDNDLVLISAKVFVSADGAVALTLSLRGADEDLRQYLTDSLMS